MELLNKLKVESDTSKNKKSESEGFDSEKTGAIRKNPAASKPSTARQSCKELLEEKVET